MTGERIKHLADIYVGGETDDEEALEVINEALDAIGDRGLVYGEITVEATPEKSYYLPKDATVVSVVLYDTGETVDNWQYRGGAITFERSGTYLIIARRQPKPLKNIADKVDIHPMFQRSLVTYLRGWLKLQYDDSSSDGHKLMDMFEFEVQRANSILKRKYSPKQVRVIRHA